jgi:hypothetical protein
MAITQAVANSFKQQLLEGKHDFQFTGGDVFKLALYVSTATLNSSTTVFTSTNEVTPSGQYTTGGGELVKPNPSTSVASGVAIVDFADLSFTGVTITARGALIYNTSSANAAVAVLDFGSDKNSDFRNFYNSVPTIYNFSSYSKNRQRIIGANLLWPMLGVN